MASCWSSRTLATSPWRTITLVLWLTLSTRVRTPASWGRRTRFWQPTPGSYGCASEEVEPQHEIVLTRKKNQTGFVLNECSILPPVRCPHRKVCDQVLRMCKGEQIRCNQRLKFTTAPWNLTYSGTYSSRFIHKAINTLMSGFFFFVNLFP